MSDWETIKKRLTIVYTLSLGLVALLVLVLTTFPNSASENGHFLGTGQAFALSAGAIFGTVTAPWIACIGALIRGILRIVIVPWLTKFG